MTWNIPTEPTTGPECSECEEGYPNENGDCIVCGEPVDMDPPEDPRDRDEWEGD